MIEPGGADKIVGAVRDLPELHRVLRAQAEQRGIARRKLDELAGLSDGHCEKLLADPPLKNIGPASMFPLLGALGLKLLVVIDPEAMIRAARMPRRRAAQAVSGAQHWRSARLLAQIRELAKDAGKQRFAKMTADEKREHQSHAAKSRWKRWRKARAESKLPRS